jgi:hypothetical protein
MSDSEWSESSSRESSSEASGYRGEARSSQAGSLSSKGGEFSSQRARVNYEGATPQNRPSRNGEKNAIKTETHVVDTGPCSVTIEEGGKAVMLVRTGEYQVQVNIHNNRDHDVQLQTVVRGSFD